MKHVGSVISDVTSLDAGDVVAIPIGRHGFGYARVYRESLGVYGYISNKVQPFHTVEKAKVAFFVGYFCTRVQRCDWIFVGRLPFRTAEESWEPATFIRDVPQPSCYRIYYRGEMRNATAQEVQGLEPFVMQPPEIIRQMIIERVSHVS